MSIDALDIFVLVGMFCCIPLFLKPIREKWRRYALVPIACVFLLWMPFLLIHVFASPSLQTALHYRSIQIRYFVLGAAVGCVVNVFLIIRTPRESLLRYLKCAGQQWLNDWKHTPEEPTVNESQQEPSHRSWFTPGILIVIAIGIELITGRLLGDALEHAILLPRTILEKKLENDEGFRTLVYWRGVSDGLYGFNDNIQMPSEESEQLVVLLNAHRATATRLLELPSRRVDPELSDLAVRLARSHLAMTDIIGKVSDQLDFIEKRLAVDVPQDARARALMVRAGKAALIQWLQASPDLVRSPTSRETHLTFLLSPIREYTDRYAEWRMLMDLADRGENDLRLLVREYSLMRTQLSRKYDVEFPTLQAIR